MLEQNAYASLRIRSVAKGKPSCAVLGLAFWHGTKVPCCHMKSHRWDRTSRGHLRQPSCSEQATVEQAARGLMRVGSAYLQGWRILQPPWATRSLQCLTTLTATNKLLYQVRTSHVPTHLYCLFSFHCAPLRGAWLHLLCSLPSVAAYDRGVPPEDTSP